MSDVKQNGAPETAYQGTSDPFRREEGMEEMEEVWELKAEEEVQAWQMERVPQMARQSVGVLTLEMQ